MAEAQREAVLALSMMEEHGVLAVNGPPGTGKTTMLQTVVANIVSQFAVEGKKEPPIIWVSSSNNQAVKNVAQSLLKPELPSAIENEVYAKSWIPQLNGKSIFLTSSESKVEGAPQWGIWPSKKIAKTEDAKGFIAEAYSDAFIENAQASIIAHASQVFEGKHTDFNEINSLIQNQLRQQQKKILKLIDDLSKLLEFDENVFILDFTEEASDLDKIINNLATDSEEDTSAYEIYNFATQLLERLTREDLLSKISSKLRSLIFKSEFDWRKISATLSGYYTSDPFFSTTTPPRKSELVSRLHSIVDKTSIQRQRVEQKKAKRDGLFERKKLIQKIADIKREYLEEADAIIQRFELSVEPPRDIRALNELLDVTMRAEMFQWSCRYWEVNYCQKVGQLDTSQLEKLRGAANTENLLMEQYRIIGCLSPVFISTLFMLPKFTNYYETKVEEKKGYQYCQKLIDLLIIDEAGQTANEIGMPSLLLSKRALIIGDEMQLEPIWNIPKHWEANLISTSGTKKLNDQFADAQYQASKGSLMTIANLCSVASRMDAQGLMLNEHRRCQKPIIAISNDLAYEGKILPVTPTLEKPLFPSLIWKDVTGSTVWEAGSLTNPGEAQFIADWVFEHSSDINNYYGTGQADVFAHQIAILTPYAAQKNLIVQKLKTAGIPVSSQNSEGVVVGTVHAMQGAERPIIIYSSVYSDGDNTNFVNEKPNMLNVIVSRAQHSLFVVGNMKHFSSKFEAKNPNPMQIVGRHLFSSDSYEYRQALEVSATETSDNLILNTLHEHQNFLFDSFHNARSLLVIHSPFWRKSAIETDGIYDQIERVTKRGVKVKIGYCPAMNDKFEDDRSESEEISHQIKEAGAEVFKTYSHDKTIIVDNKLITFGSFNWLSAVRDSQAKFSFKERSFVYTNADVEAEIREFLDRYEI